MLPVFGMYAHMLMARNLTKRQARQAVFLATQHQRAAQLAAEWRAERDLTNAMHAMSACRHIMGSMQKTADAMVEAFQARSAQITEDLLEATRSGDLDGILAEMKGASN